VHQALLPLHKDDFEQAIQLLRSLTHRACCLAVAGVFQSPFGGQAVVRAASHLCNRGPRIATSHDDNTALHML
jgi:hypothetical protein